MPAYYSDNPKRPKRAQQLWIILVGKAANRQLVTYNELKEMLGYGGSGVFSQTLGHIACYCIQNELPGLTSLVVSEEKGVPGEGIPVDDAEAERIDVFKFDWYNLVPPSPEELKAAWDNPTCEK